MDPVSSRIAANHPGGAFGWYIEYISIAISSLATPSPYSDMSALSKVALPFNLVYNSRLDVLFVDPSLVVM